jgi:ketosteroid isomerase-like protein
MKRFLYISMMITVLGCFLAISAPLFAQEWSAEQKEVWQNEETYAKLSAAGNTEGCLAYYHPDYVGWYDKSPTPANKEVTSKFISYGQKTTKILVYDIQPLSIKIYGNVAIVHLYYTQIYKDSEGKEKSSTDRWTDIWMKQGDKWLLIGDHGGPTSSN